MPRNIILKQTIGQFLTISNVVNDFETFLVAGFFIYGCNTLKINILKSVQSTLSVPSVF